jgi:hypothetical protein
MFINENTYRHVTGKMSNFLNRFLHGVLERAQYKNEGNFTRLIQALYVNTGKFCWQKQVRSTELRKHTDSPNYQK